MSNNFLLDVERDKRIYADDLHRDAVVRALEAEKQVQILTAQLEELRKEYKTLKRKYRKGP